ncbi:MAG: nucleotidyltransferase family protein [Candidatus Aenigmarchaeota archaeon]|nr:nucleotidyltransferase family protein [Candidatus Aenigmarchaeota archaeon]
MKNKNPTSENILKSIEKHRKDIRSYGVKRIGLFGSHLKGTSHKKSDLDLLVTFYQPTFDNYMGLKFFLERLFRRKVDLVIEESLKPAFRYVKKEAMYASEL